MGSGGGVFVRAVHHKIGFRLACGFGAVVILILICRMYLGGGHSFFDSGRVSSHEADEIGVEIGNVEFSREPEHDRIIKRMVFLLLAYVGMAYAIVPVVWKHYIRGRPGEQPVSLGSQAGYCFRAAGGAESALSPPRAVLAVRENRRGGAFGCGGNQRGVLTWIWDKLLVVGGAIGNHGQDADATGAVKAKVENRLAKGKVYC